MRKSKILNLQSEIKYSYQPKVANKARICRSAQEDFRYALVEISGMLAWLSRGECEIK